eukprot:Colp12_sorted_trinity150504_noHs@35672
MKQLDPSLGEPLPDKDYATSCALYDAEHPETPFAHLLDKVDSFIIAHALGWYAKALILRDAWLCHVISIMFELLEYSLEFQLANFKECWWDHWILDALVCNWGGIYLGLKTCEWLEMKTYKWQNLWTIPSYKERLRRAAAQFTPHDWTRFEWGATSSLKKWIGMNVIIVLFLLAELNSFYLKYLLWLPPPTGSTLHVLLWSQGLGQSL